jgi:hypothetical protein
MVVYVCVRECVCVIIDGGMQNFLTAVHHSILSSFGVFVVRVVLVVRYVD